MSNDHVTQTVAIEFFKSIYYKIVHEFPEPNFDHFTVPELKSFFSLSDMYFLDSSKILLKQKLKEKKKQENLRIGKYKNFMNKNF